MAQISLPNQLVNGTVADASQVMANFNAIVDVVNGNLGSDNLEEISGADVTVLDAIAGGTGTLNDFTQRIQAGRAYTGDVIEPGEDYSIEVDFPTPFPGAPIVLVQPRTHYPGRRFASAHNITRSSFELFVHKTQGADSGFSVYWLAVYAGAM